MLRRRKWSPSCRLKIKSAGHRMLLRGPAKLHRNPPTIQTSPSTRKSWPWMARSKPMQPRNPVGVVSARLEIIHLC